MKSRLRPTIQLVFALSSLLTVAVLAVPPTKDYFQGWKKYQSRYNVLVGQMAKQGTMAQPVRIGIIQVFNPDLGVVDRCQTCHVSILDPSFRNAVEPFRAHPETPHDISTLGCIICHGGNGRATSEEDAHANGLEGHPLLEGNYVAAYCGQCHEGVHVPEAHDLNAGRTLVGESNCTGCHHIPGFTRNQILRAPDLDGIGDKVTPQWLYLWLKHPKSYLPRTLMPNFILSDQEASLLTTFLVESRMEATGSASIPNRGDAEEGKTLFRERRCVSCHAVNGRGGTLAPDLGKVGSKLKPEWLPRWLDSPRQLFHASRMPQFSLSRDKVLALSEYISTELIDDEQNPDEADRIAKQLPAPTAPTVKRGLELYEKLGCSRCHNLKGIENKGEFGPDLESIGDRDLDLLDFGNARIQRTLPSWLTAKLKNPRGFGGKLLMPDYEFPDEEIRNVVTALLSITSRQVPERYRDRVHSRPDFRPAGTLGRIIEKYQCMTCHRIQGTGGTLAPDITIAGSQLRLDWMRRFFASPYTIRPILQERMPVLDMSKDEIETVVTYIGLGLRDDSIPDEVFTSPPVEAINRGRSLFYETYGCQSCHQVRMSGGYVGPPLDGVRDRLTQGYIFLWLKNPQAIMPEVIDPNRGLNDGDARDLTAFLLSLPTLSGAKRE